MPKISVLIPAYNVERYLPKCLDSVLSQTFENFEVILIDDGSTDGTGKICDDYAAKDSRIKVYHQDNKGISATRNLCLQYATGEYIQFVDSDDWIEPTMLKTMFDAASDNEAEIVGCNFVQVFQRKCEKIRTFYETKDEFLRAVLSNQWGVLWKLLIKRTVLKRGDILFPENINGGEDYYFVVCALVESGKVLCVDEYFYNYNRINEKSTISTPTKDKILEQISATKLVEGVLECKGLGKIYSSEMLLRKFYSKYRLAKYDPKLWAVMFPESNSLCWKYAHNLKDKLWMKFWEIMGKMNFV